MVQATGPGGTDVFATAARTFTSGASLADGTYKLDSKSASLAHGLVMVIATLVLAPIDIITASALRRWPVLHMVTSFVFLAFVLVGMGLGIILSMLYIAVSAHRYLLPI